MSACSRLHLLSRCTARACLLSQGAATILKIAVLLAPLVLIIAYFVAAQTPPEPVPEAPKGGIFKLFGKK